MSVWFSKEGRLPLGRTKTSHGWVGILSTWGRRVSLTQRGKHLPGLDSSRRPTRWPCSPANAGTCSAMEKEVEPGEGAVLRRVLSGEVGRPLHVALWNGARGEGQAAGGQRRPLNASHQRTCAQALSEKCFAGWAAEGMLPGGSASGGQQLCLREPHTLTAVIC